MNLDAVLMLPVELVQQRRTAIAGVQYAYNNLIALQGSRMCLVCRRFTI
jgi:hypothetical protein